MDISRGEPLFLKTGITFVSLSIVGKQPDSKDRLNRKERGPERSNLKRRRIVGEMLLGPDDLFRDRELIVSNTSAGFTRSRKIEFLT